MVDLKELALRVENLEKARKAFDDLKMVPGYKFDISCRDKTVLDDGEGDIIKMEPLFAGMKRKALAQYFKKIGFPILVEGIIVPECTTEYLLTTREERINDVGWRSDDMVLQAITEKYGQERLKEFQDLMKKFSMHWYGSNFNTGLDSNGDIKIFDYVACVSVKQDFEGDWTLIRNGEVLHHVQL